MPKNLSLHANRVNLEMSVKGEDIPKPQPPHDRETHAIDHAEF
jgi:hypothetical protein